MLGHLVMSKNMLCVAAISSKVYTHVSWKKAIIFRCPCMPCDLGVTAVLIELSAAW